MKRKKLWSGITAVLVIIAVAVTAGLLWHEEQQLEELRNEALEKLERDVGQYDEQSIVLNGTSKAKAEELAELYGAELRITENGRFATLTLPEGTTIRDVYAMDESLKHIEDMAADYHVQVSEIETEEEGNGERLPMRPQYSVSDTDYELQSYLDYLNMGNVWNNYKGNGITVAVIDTGIDTDHPEFAGRISEYSYNATEDKIVKDWLLEDGSYDWSLVEDEVGHGTAVTGVIAATMNSGNVVGIAPNVNIIVIKAECDPNGNFKRTSDLVFGLYYAIERDAQVVNMSFGTYAPVNPFEEVAQLAYDSDIICVAAAGNETTSSLCWPAADENVIGVGALGDGWILANYSNYGENTDLVAPGSTYTCAMGGGHATTQGTSLASPIVAGAIALYMQTDKYTTFDKVTEILYASCYDLGDLGRDWYYGFGAIDISAFILEARGTIIYDMLTDELENEEGIYIQGHTLQELPEPERLYAVFDGWYYDDTFTQEYDYYADKFYGEEITLYAKWANEDDGIPYTYVILYDGTVEIRSYTGHRRYITIPEKIDGRIVSSIGDFAFSGQTRLREVGLPSGLTHIGLNAFENCANLISIQIPENVTEIEDYAFKDNVRLSSIAFLGNSKLQTIGIFAFQNCGKLERIELPAALTSINGAAFFGATSLNSITVQKGNTAFRSVDGVLFNLSGSTLVAFPAAHGNSYTLPTDTTTIGDYGFACAKIKTVDLANVQSIGGRAFTYAALESLVIPDGVSNMGERAFAFNTRLAKVTIGRGLTQIPKETFVSTTSLNTVTIPNGITVIGGAAFSGSGLTSVVFEENSSLMLIGNSAFFDCNITEIDIPASVLEIGAGAFSGAYVGNPLIRVGFTSNANLHTIGGSAFAKCWLLENMDLPASLRTIGDFAFQSSGLKEATIPAGVTTLGDGALSLCSNLTAITVEAGNAVYHDLDGIVYNLDNTALHTFPAGKAVDTYYAENTVRTIMPWAFAGTHKLDSIVLPEGLTVVGEYGLYLSGINSVTLPETLEEIQQYALAKCSNLYSVHIPDNVLQIGRYAFAHDWNLQSATFNETAKLPRISFDAFSYCGITSFRVPANVSTMAQKAFEGCNNLTSFVFAQNSKLESISAYMFDGCSNLRSITFEQGSALTSIQAHGLEGMDKLTSIDFGDAKLTNVDNFAFRFCESLSTLNLPETVTNIGRYAFYCCKNLSELTIPKNVEHIGSYAFLATKDIDLYFVNVNLPAYLDENWDHDTKGYYTGVTSVKEEDNWKYAILESGSIAILKYLGEETSIDLSKLNLGAAITAIGGSVFEGSTVQTIVLPASLTAIQAEAFAYSDLTAITIPANVTFIGREAFAYTDIATLTFAAGSKLSVMEQYAFAGTKQLASVILPKSLKTMGTGVFAESGLQSVVFEQGIQLTEIPQKAFTNTKLTKVILPDSVTLVNHNAFNNVQTLQSVTFGKNEGIRLMSNAFYHTGLEALHIPANVTYIGEYCFVALPNLKSFSVDENNPNYKAVDGLLMNKSGRKLVAVPAGRTGNLTVPESVEEIGFGAFEESKLSEIKFPSDANILTFGYRAFFKAENITIITIPKSVVSIDYYAFAYCENLQEVIFAEGNQLKGIYEGAFLGCINLENIAIPDTIVEISDFAFYGCSKIDELPISQNSQVKGIYDYAFAYTGLKGEFTTPETLWDIGNYAFLGCNFTKVTIPDTNKKILIIGIGAFEECNQLTEITLPFIGAGYEDKQISWFGYIFGAGSYEANVSYVPKSLKTVSITEGITNIYIGGFADCIGLEIINIPDSVSVVWNHAFRNTTAKYKFADVVTPCWLNISTGAVYATVHEEHFGKGITGGVELSENVVSISFEAFSGCGSLESITIPDGVSSIGANAFAGCSSLTHITIPGTNKMIRTSTFAECTNLRSVVIEEGVTHIQDNVFRGCSNLSAIKIPDSMKSISAAFAGCVNLENVYIQSIENWCAIKFIGDHSGVWDKTIKLYVNNQLVRDLIIPEGVESITDYAFAHCGWITSITLPKSVVSIGQDAFSGCGSLYEVYNNSGIAIELGSSAHGGVAAYARILVDQAGNKAYRDESSDYTCIDTADGFRFLYEKGEYSLLAYFGEQEIVTLPISINGNKYKIEYFRGARHLIIPNGIETIGASAFRNNDSLVSVTIESGVHSIEYRAFLNCSQLETVVIGDDVTVIEEYAFANCKKLKSISIGKSVKKIGNNAFGDCVSLASVEIPDSVEYMGSVFRGCTNLAQVILGNGITRIADSTFSKCISLERIQIPDGVTTIGNHAFNSCSGLTSAEIPDGVTEIGSDAFYGCENLQSVVLPSSVKNIGGSAFSAKTEVIFADDAGFKMIEGILYNAALTEIIYVTSDVSGDICLPDSVKNISDKFKNCKLITSITIPNSVTYIGVNAFTGCTSLTSVTIPNCVTYIGANAFSGCASLTSITIPDSVRRIGEYAFSRCSSMKSITLSKNITEIAMGAFYQCIELESVEIPDGVISINGAMLGGAFQGCTSLKSITLPDSLTDIGDFAFSGCSRLTSVLFVDGVVSIGKSAFSGCAGLTHVSLSVGLTNIFERAFYGCSGLSSITIPDGVTTIGNYAFYNCFGLTSVSIPQSVTEIGEEVFWGCSSLKHISIAEENNSYCFVDGILYDKPVTKILWVSEQIQGNIVILDGVTSIGGVTFYGREGLTSITIPKSVISINNRAFEACRNLKKVINKSALPLKLGDTENGYVAAYAIVLVDPDGKITYISDCYFETEDHFLFQHNNGSYSLLGYLGNQETVTLPANVNGCNYDIVDFFGASNIIIPDGIKALDSQAFFGCTSLVSISIPQSVTQIGAYAFAGCTSLVSITIPDSVTQIGAYAFAGCTSLVSISIPDGVDSLSQSVFDGCSSLVSITIPDSVTFIHESAFTGCTSLNEFVLGENYCYIDGILYNNPITKIIWVTHNISGDVIIQDGVTSILREFWSRQDLLSITIPGSVQFIDERAFEYCYKLAKVTIQEGVAFIGNWAFSECHNLASITIPDSMIDIGLSTFDHCDSLFNNPDNYTHGMFVINGWLIDVNEHLMYLSDVKDIRGVYGSLYGNGGAYANCHQLKNAVWGAAELPSNVETVYITNMSNLTPKLKNMLTLKSVVICDTVNPSDLRYCQDLFSQISGITIYVEAEEEDLRWNDNFPGWNNGNVVIYGDNWNYASFYDADGHLICTEPKRNSEIIRRPVVNLPAGTESDSYELLGWDMDGDGVADSVPATTTIDIAATAIICHIHTHIFGEWHQTKAPNCTERGEEQRYCQYCDHYETREIMENGHSYTSKVTAPTCTEKGYTTHTCACGYSYTDSEVAAIGHKDTNKDHVCDNGCGVSQGTHADGSDADHKCDYGCGVDNMTEHSYTSVVTAPTCTNKGYTTHTCACGNSYTDSEVAALGHKDTNKDHVCDNGCGVSQGTHADGNDADHKCDYGCGVVLSDHSYTSVVTKPTCTKKGYTTHTCACGHSYIDSYVDKVAHSFSNYVSDGNATTEADGTKTALCDYGCGTKDTVTDEGSKITVSNITSDKYTVTGDYISEINAGTTAAELLKGINEAEYIIILKNDQQVAATTTLGTGMVVRLMVGDRVMKEVEVVISGDTSGDGKITVTDMISVKSHVLKKSTLEGANAKAADVNGDGVVSITDFIQIKSHILGKSEIKPATVETTTLSENTEKTATLSEALEVTEPAQNTVAEEIVIAEDVQEENVEQASVPASDYVSKEFLVPGKNSSLGIQGYHKERYV